MDTCEFPNDAARTAIAVCGCGLDGRLGIGSGAPSTLHEITLLDDFLTGASSQTHKTVSPSQSGSVPGIILQVACGAYHTLVLTTAGLYGWGLHEDGQLGLGRPNNAEATVSKNAMACGGGAAEAEKTTVAPFFERPTLIPFFHRLGDVPTGECTCLRTTGGAEAEEKKTVDENEPACNVISVHCGADHSIVRTTSGVYVTGRNDCGQLGLGHTKTVYTWTLLCGFNCAASVAVADFATNSKDNVCNSASLFSLPSVTRTDDSYTQLVRGQLTHISCGTHHTLLAWTNALVLHSAGREAEAAAQQHQRLFFYPTLLMACGRGDFGELGYDGDAWAILQAKAQRQERSALAEALNQQKRRLTSDSTTVNAADTVTMISGTTTAAVPYQLKWKAARVVRKRRPPFNSPYFQPVKVKELTDNAVELPAMWTHKVSASLTVCNPSSINELNALLSPSTSEEKLLQLVKSSVASSLASNVSEPESPMYTRWEVVRLQAMHHHSAVTLRELAASHSNTSPANCFLVLHWGCYYCSEIEDDASSIPRPLVGSSDAEGRGKGSKDGHWGVHAGDEIFFRYTAPFHCTDNDSGGSVPLIQVIGTGNLGRGDDDDEARTWADMPSVLSAAAATPAAKSCVSSIHGRSHFLFSVSNPSAGAPPTATCKSTDSNLVAVVGFGDNLHGQLGSPTTHSNVAASSEARHDDDTVVTPRPVLQLGDTLRVASAVKKSLLNAAPPPHNHLIEKAGDVPNAAEQWVVEKIRAVGAGARHSVFVVDVRPLLQQSGA